MDEILCRECTGRKTGDQSDIVALAKRGAISVGTILMLLLLRSIDEIVRLSVRASNDLLVFRPFVPILTVYGSTGGEALLIVTAVGLFVFFANLLLPIPILDLVTFPGTVVHEWAHLQACRYYDLEVYDVVYFQLDGMLGYVRHEVPDDLVKHLGVSCAPLLCNTGIAISIALVVTIGVDHIGWIPAIVLLWVAFSIAVCALPSTIDAENVWERILREWTNRPSVLLVIPIILLLYLTNILRIAFVEILYGIFVLITGIYIGLLFI